MDQPVGIKVQFNDANADEPNPAIDLIICRVRHSALWLVAVAVADVVASTIDKELSKKKFYRSPHCNLPNNSFQLLTSHSNKTKRTNPLPSETYIITHISYASSSDIRTDNQNILSDSVGPDTRLRPTDRLFIPPFSRSPSIIYLYCPAKRRLT